MYQKALHLAWEIVDENELDITDLDEWEESDLYAFLWEYSYEWNPGINQWEEM